VCNDSGEPLPLAHKNRYAGAEARPDYAPDTRSRGERNILNKLLEKVRNLNLDQSVGHQEENFLGDLLYDHREEDPLAGMIAEGVTFQQCEVPPMADADESIYLRQVALEEQTDGRDRRVLLISDDHESDAEGMALAHN